MLSSRMENALNEQLTYELYSAYYYVAAAAHFDHANFKGFAHWNKLQAHEEVNHAQRFYDYINDAGGRVILGAIDQPPSEFDSPLSVFEAALAHERDVTRRIHSLVDLAIEEKDHATNAFLQWFVTEQVEEEAQADEVVQQLRMAGDAPSAVLIIDRQLAQRSHTE